MKPLVLIPVLMLSACTSHAPRKIISVAVAPSRPVSAAALRTGEQLREYRFGRYVDPGDPLVMHDDHPVYRVETSAGWNLRPGNTSQPAQRESVAAPSVSANDAVVAEVNKQRAVTRAVTEQATTLNQRLGEMSKAAAQTQELATLGLALKRDMAALRERMDSFDTQLRERKPAAPDRPQPRAEDKW
ncbi:MAG: hypothetical protein ABJF10_11515 [Chthoniobacter sp.]|uniref:hypothetical protein n=1 Tax=Chthoniobacter sp. TaxID=2510640 RepID=UPI0032A36830